MFTYPNLVEDNFLLMQQWVNVGSVDNSSIKNEQFVENCHRKGQKKYQLIYYFIAQDFQ